MARPLRVEYPGAFYHVMSRSIGNEKIYRINQDREKFLRCLNKAAQRFFISIHAYCLMNNHYHLLVETPYANLGLAMQWLNVSYAVYFNRRLRRHGHLFQGRYKALLVDADTYLKQLSRYIHLNPVRSQLASRPGDYRWSSYCAYIGKNKAPKFLVTNRLLNQFGKTEKEAKRNYRDFVENVDAYAVENPNTLSVEGFLLGSEEFVNWVKSNFLTLEKNDKEIPQLKKLKPRAAIESIVKAVAEEFCCGKDKITAKGLKNNKAREVAIYIARNMSGMSCKDLGEYFGGVTGAAITVMYKRMERESIQIRKLKNRIEKIVANI